MAWQNAPDLREKVTPDTLPALKKELVRRSKPGYILPEKVAGSENLRSVEKEWEFVFMEQVTQHVMQPEARQVARLMCGKTKHLTAERHKEIRTALRGTDLHEAAKNSAFCRMMLGRPPLSPTLEWPDEFDEYDMVNMEADGVCHTVQAAALQSVLEEVMQGAGDGKDKHPHRVRVQDLRILPGPKTPAACEKGEPVLGRTAVFKAAWCEGTRRLLTSDETAKVGDKATSLKIKLPRDQMLTLNRNTTAVFLAVCKACGLTEAEARSLVAYCLSEQLEGIAGVSFKTCAMEMGKPPHAFWNWWSESTEVEVFFNTKEAMRKAVVAVSRGNIDLYAYDGGTIETSVLVLRLYVIQNRSMQMSSEEETEVSLYAGVHAATRARNNFYLQVSGFNHLTYLGVKTEYGHICAASPDLLETRLEEKLRLIAPDLIARSCELVRRDTAQEEAAADLKQGARAPRIEGQSLGGGGLRAWFTKVGMRMFCNKDEAPVLEEAIRTCLDVDGDIFHLFPNQPPQSLTVTRVNEKKRAWTGTHTAKGKAKEVTEEEFGALTLAEYGGLMEAKLEEHRRMTLPAEGQPLEEQFMEQDVAWPTLRNVLQKHLPLPAKITWQDVVEYMENTCTFVDRVELQLNSDDRRLLEHYEVHELTVPERRKAWQATRTEAVEEVPRTEGEEDSEEEGGGEMQTEQLTLQQRKDEAAEHEDDRREQRGLGPETPKQRSRRDKLMDLEHQEEMEERGEKESKVVKQAARAAEGAGGAVNRTAADVSHHLNPEEGGGMDYEDDDAAASALAGADADGMRQGAEASMASVDGGGGEQLNDSMELSEVAVETEDEDIMQQQLRQATELAKQQQAQHHLDQHQRGQMSTLQAGQVTALEQMPAGSREQEWAQQQVEVSNLTEAHRQQQQEMLGQQRVQHEQHAQVIAALRASNPQGASPAAAAGGSGTQ
jgi:hypothetical protein